MALDPNIILAGQNPENMMLNALAIKGQMQQQNQAAAMAPLQQQSAQLGVQGQQLEVQQRQYQMDQQRRMMEAAQRAFTPQSMPSATPSAPSQPAQAMPPAANPQPPVQSAPDSGNPDEMPQLAAPSSAGVGPATSADSANPDEIPQLSGSSPVQAPARQTSPASMAQPSQAPRVASQQGDPWEQFFTNMQQSGVHPQTVMAMRKEHQALLQGAASLSLDQQKILQNQMNVYADVAKTALNQPDDTTREQYYQSTGKPALLQAGIAASALPDALPTGDQGRAFLQQHLLTAQANGSVLSRVGEQQNTLAQTLGAAKDAVDYMTRLRNAKDSGNFLPSVVNNFPQTYTGPETIAQARALGQTPEQQENAPKQEAAAQQALLASDAQKLANAALMGPQAYRATLDAMPHGRASAFPEPPPDGSYDPKAFSEKVASMGLTPQERSVAATTQAQRAEAARHNQAMESLRSVSNNIRQQIASRNSGASGQANLNAQADLHDRLMSQAEEDRNQASQLDQLGTQPVDPNKDVYLPDGGGKSVKWNDATKQYAAQQAQTLRQRAQNLDNQATAIRARNHFGEFGTGAPSAAPVAPGNPPSAPNATPAPTAAPAATPAPPASKPPASQPAPSAPRVAAPARPAPTAAPASATAPPAPAKQYGAPNARPGAKIWNVGGRSVTEGSPVWVGGKQMIFDGLDSNGKILAH